MSERLETPVSCSVCRGLDVAVSSDSSVSLDTVKASAAGGCQTCKLLFSSVLALSDGKEDTVEHVLAWDTKRIDGLRVIVSSQKPSEFQFSLDMFCLPGDRPPWIRQKHGETAIEISGNTGSKEAIATVARWMEGCKSSHSCGSASPSPLPTRLLDISRPGEVHLYCPGTDITGFYACLSHCWGTSQPLMTTSLNLDLLRQGVAVNEFPQSFQDAIDFTRKLGIPYLWIDSLCIIQDSMEDWQVESARMAEIYANCTVCIAASSASSDAEGFIRSSPPCYRSKVQKYVAADGSDATVHIRRTLAHGIGTQPLPLLTRAWVLQERFLSPRVVHFTSEELVWECMEQTTCECGCIRYLWSPGWTPFDKHILHEPLLSMASRAELREKWHRVVEEYSGLKLTFAKDKLPAISGAARKLAPFRQTTYHAGLWRDSMIHDLAWARRDSRDGSDGSDGSERGDGTEHAPSWSWASCLGRVEFSEAMSALGLATVLACTCEEAPGADAFGRIIGGALAISGYFARLPVAMLRGAAGPSSQLGNDTDASSEQATARVILDRPGTVSLKVDAIFCLRILSQRGVFATGKDHEVSLLLYQNDKDGSLFRRVGLLEVILHGLEPAVDIYSDVEEPTTVTII